MMALALPGLFRRWLSVPGQLSRGFIEIELRKKQAFYIGPLVLVGA